MSFRRFVPVLLLILAAWFVPARAADPGKPARLVFGHLAPCATLDPALAVDVDSIQAVRALFEGLVRLRDGGLEVEPGLAESWESDPTGTRWLFTLRPGVRFHDGAPCDAAAVAFSFQRIMNPQHAYYAGNRSLPMPLGSVAEVKALDQRRVLFILSQPHAGFLQGLTLPQLSVVSPAAMAEQGKDFSRHPVGTGPFVFDHWAPDGTVTVRANPRYWGAAPRLAEVVFRPVANDAQRFHDFAAGSLDVMAGVLPADAARMARMADAKLHSLPGLAVSYLAMNTEHPPLDRPEVRQAVAHAINTTALLRLIYQDQADPARGILPPGVPGYDPNLAAPAYDPALSRRLLAKSGLAKGFSVTLMTMNTPRPYLPRPVRAAEAIKGNLEAVGITAHIVPQDFPTFLDQVTRGQHDMCLLGWAMDTPDPDDFLNTSFTGTPGMRDLNVSNWRDARVQDLLGQARGETDPGRRAEIYVRLQKIVLQESPWVPLAHPRMLLAVHSRVHGLVLQPTGDVRFHEAWKQ